MYSKKLLFRKKAFSCEFYGNTFTSTINAEIHTYHSCSFRNEAFSCKFCGKTFTPTINVERHIIAVHLGMKPLVVNFVEKHSHQLSM